MEWPYQGVGTIDALRESAKFDRLPTAVGRGVRGTKGVGFWIPTSDNLRLRSEAPAARA
jgi:hypothetical protein